MNHGQESFLFAKYISSKTLLNNVDHSIVCSGDILPNYEGQIRF